MRKQQFIDIDSFPPSRIKELRHNLKLTQSCLAECLGVAVDTVRHWEQKQGCKGGSSIRLLQLLEKNGIPETLIRGA